MFYVYLHYFGFLVLPEDPVSGGPGSELQMKLWPIFDSKGNLPLKQVLLFDM
jgi:hypothetical protein